MHVPSLGLHNRYPSYKWQHFDNFGFLTHLIFWLNQKKKKKVAHNIYSWISIFQLCYWGGSGTNTLKVSVPALFLRTLFLPSCHFLPCTSAIISGQAKENKSVRITFSKNSHNHRWQKKKKKNLDKDLEAFLNWLLEKKLKHWMTSAVKSSKTIKKFLV